MCGIFGVIGDKKSYSITKLGLERLAYRGYDSAGIASVSEKSFLIKKVSGHPKNLPDFKCESSISIGHNRWATHSLPTKENAHPYTSNDGKIVLVHNGIIENYATIRDDLIKEGFIFHSKTDTEVIPNLLQLFINEDNDILSAINKMSKRVEGAYAIAFIHLDFPEQINVVRMGSPICIGKLSNSYYISSDLASLPAEVKEAIHLDNEKIAIIKKDDLSIFTFCGKTEATEFEELTTENIKYSKGVYNSFLEKEIFEQPIYIKNATSGRAIYSENNSKIILSGIFSHIDEDVILNADEIYFVGCGSAYHSAKIGARAMSQLAGIRCRAVIGGELQYDFPVITDKTVMIAISQSGETADTIGCINLFKEKGATILGIVNVVNSTISRLVDAGIYIRAGKEISVASTKALTNQILTLIMLAAYIGRRHNLSSLKYNSIIEDLNNLPTEVERLLLDKDRIKNIATTCSKFNNIICIGRGFLETISFETALKIKEISYIHAEGYSAAELKHGPLALVCPDTLTMAFSSNDYLSNKMLGNVKEVKSRNGPVLIISGKKEGEIIDVSDIHIFIETKISSELVKSILFLIAGQLLSLYIAESKGANIDEPRHLAKSVTVE